MTEASFPAKQVGGEEEGKQGQSTEGPDVLRCTGNAQLLCVPNYLYLISSGKSHIPDGPGYQEKFYFSPGDTGFRVWKTKVGVVGVAICWDQWFPEAARAMALQGADILLYPTAIGSEPQDPTINSTDHWQQVMQGHAAANMVPVVASNRIGTEILTRDDDPSTQIQQISFYGRTFITDETGMILEEADASKPFFDVITATIDIEANRSTRLAWGLFRDRRPELYGVLQTKDGHTPLNL